jgi:hypothetical protein
LIKKEIEDASADKTIPDSERKQFLEELNQVLKSAESIQFPSNIEVVEKYYDKIDVTTIAAYDGDRLSTFLVLIALSFGQIAVLTPLYSCCGLRRNSEAVNERSSMHLVRVLSSPPREARAIICIPTDQTAKRSSRWCRTRSKLNADDRCRSPHRACFRAELLQFVGCTIGPIPIDDHHPVSISRSKY